MYTTKPADAKVGIIGLGYVGLPLALLCCKKGYHVTGIDTDKTKIAHLKQATSYIPDIAGSEIKTVRDKGKLMLSTDYQSIGNLDIIIICVPTPLTKNHEPDLRHVKAVSTELYPHLQIGQLIILESSTYPGTTEDVIRPILEKGNHLIGSDVHLAYSPERIDPGNKSVTIKDIPKIVSGTTDACLAHITDFYSQIFTEVVPASSVKAAELSKLLENSYRFINISFINEMAMLCDKLNINLWEAISYARTKPYGFQPFYPGPGIGGHCIPVDPHYLNWAGRQQGFHNHFLTTAAKINHDISAYIVTQITQLIEQKKAMTNANILLCGITYKKDSNDMRTSPPLQIMQSLLKSGATVSYHDPYVPVVNINQKTYHHLDLTPDILRKMDIVVLLTDHTNLPLQQISHHADLVYDTKNMLDGIKGHAQVITLGGGSSKI